MQFWTYLLLFLSVFLGGGFAFLLKQRQGPFIQYLLAFSGAYLLGLTLMHLMPDVFIAGGHEVGIWMIGGFLLQLLLEQLSQGAEHGHVHVLKGSNLGKALPVLLGLSLHSIIEGLPLGSFEHLSEVIGHHSHGHGSHDGVLQHFLWGIILHKIPAAFALAALMMLSGFRKEAIWGALLIFALTAPLSAFFADQFIKTTSILLPLMGLVVGSFLHIGTTILFESENKGGHHISWTKFFLVVAGFGLSLLSLH